MTDQRIKLAEFVGWQKIYGTSLDPCTHWRAPDGTDWENETALPDPRNDANDSEALIRKLEDHGIEVTLSFDHGHESVSSVDTEEWPAPVYIGDDWKHGVCDLAEKVIDAADRGRSDD